MDSQQNDYDDHHSEEHKSLDYEIRSVRKDELNQVQQMTVIESWNYTCGAILESYSIDPEHRYAAVTPEGAVISHCSWTPVGGEFGNKMAWISLFVTKEGYRKRGIGKRVFNMCLKSCGDFNIGLNAVIHTQPLYRRLGFQHTGHTILTYWSPIKKDKRTAMATPHIPASLTIRDIHEVPKEDILCYDNQLINPLPRILALGLLMQDHHVFQVAFQGEVIVGYGCVRKARVGYDVKPLYANDEIIAKALFNSLIERIPCQEVIELQVVEENPQAKKLFESYGMVQDEIKLIQMFSKEVVSPRNAGFVYSMTDFDKSLI